MSLGHTVSYVVPISAFLRANAPLDKFACSIHMSLGHMDTTRR